MLSLNSSVFFCLSDDPKDRVLHPAQITEVNDQLYTATAETPTDQLVEGQQLHAMFEMKNKFMRIAAHVEQLLSSLDSLVLMFRPLGEPESVEGRASYRVCTALEPVSCMVGDKMESQVLDVSSTGFAIRSTSRYSQGATLRTMLKYRGETFSGAAVVRNIRPLRTGHIRYGLSAVTDRAAAGPLLKGLNHLTITLQRMQLKRLSGLA